MSAAEEDPPDPEQPGPFHLRVDDERARGVWANLAVARASAHEFNIDFVRSDPYAPARQGVLVARVAMSPVLVVQLIDLLQQVWQTWSNTQLPREGPPTDGT
jgi:hypothetical protein